MHAKIQPIDNRLFSWIQIRHNRWVSVHQNHQLDSFYLLSILLELVTKVNANTSETTINIKIDKTCRRSPKLSRKETILIWVTCFATVNSCAFKKMLGTKCDHFGGMIIFMSRNNVLNLFIHINSTITITDLRDLSLTVVHHCIERGRDDAARIGLYLEKKRHFEIRMQIISHLSYHFVRCIFGNEVSKSQIQNKMRNKKHYRNWLKKKKGKKVRRSHLCFLVRQMCGCLSLCSRFETFSFHHEQMNVRSISKLSYRFYVVSGATSKSLMFFFMLNNLDSPTYLPNESLWFFFFFSAVLFVVAFIHWVALGVWVYVCASLWYSLRWSLTVSNHRSELNHIRLLDHFESSMIKHQTKPI